MIEKQLVRRLKTLGTLLDAVTAMKSLSAHHFLQARHCLKAARDYRIAVDEIIDQVGFHFNVGPSGPAGFLLVTSDLGLCGDYNTRLLEAAVGWLDDHEHSRIYVLGNRGQALLAKQHHDVARTYPGPASVEGLPRQLLSVAEDVIDDYSQGVIGSLEVCSAKFSGAGRFEVVSTRLLPFPNASDHRVEDASRLHDEASRTFFRTPYQSLERLLASVVREHLYIEMYQVLLEALASEHGMRLVAAENARGWIDDTGRSVKRRLAAVRREISTQEVLDIVSSSRKRASVS